MCVCFMVLVVSKVSTCITSATFPTEILLREFSFHAEIRWKSLALVPTRKSGKHARITKIVSKHNNSEKCVMFVVCYVIAMRYSAHPNTSCHKKRTTHRVKKYLYVYPVTVHGKQASNQLSKMICVQNLACLTVYVDVNVDVSVINGRRVTAEVL